MSGSRLSIRLGGSAGRSGPNAPGLGRGYLFSSWFHFILPLLLLDLCVVFCLLVYSLETIIDHILLPSLL